MISRPAALVLACVVTACGASADPALPRSPPAAAAPPPPTTTAPTLAAAPAPEGPWGIRFVRSCLVYAPTQLFASGDRVFACSGGIYDAESGALTGFQADDAYAVGLLHDSSLWRVLDTDWRMRVRTESGALEPFTADAPIWEIAASSDGSRRLGRGDDALYWLDEAARTASPVEGSERCASALAIGFTREGAPACLVACDDVSCVRTLGPDGGEARLPRRAVGDARFDPRGGVVLVRWEDGAAFLDTAGHVLAERPLARAEGQEASFLASTDAGAMLVATDVATELWSLEGTSVRVEHVLDEPAHEAIFAGPHVVATVRNGEVVWARRGVAASPSLPPPSPPAGFRALTPGEDGRVTTFEEDGMVLNRDPGDVAAFTSQDGEIVVRRSDAGELARFTDDAAWAAAVATRFVEHGSERWAYWFRDAEGHRTVLGHAYIGGCERTHFDVRVTERGDVLEVWSYATAEREGVRGALGERPSDAHEIVEARDDTFHGDPSTGPL